MKKINNACNYVIQKSSMQFFPNIHPIHIYFKVGKIFFCKYLEKSSKMMFNIILRKLPSHHREIFVMKCNLSVYI